MTDHALGDHNVKTFSQRNRERCESQNGFNHPLMSWNLSDWMTATLGELGEAANVVKKLNRYRDGIILRYQTETEAELRQMLADEIADAAIYLDLLAQAAGFDLEIIREAKFQKTNKKIGYIGDGLDVHGTPLTGKELQSDLEDGVSR